MATLSLIIEHQQDENLIEHRAIILMRIMRVASERLEVNGVCHLYILPHTYPPLKLLYIL